jgi:hypothetical protein
MAAEQPDFSKMSDAEIADWQYAHRDELDAALDSDATRTF